MDSPNKVGVGFFDQNDDNAGTLIYQAPEQIKGITYGKKIDIWSTGIIMYEILTKGGHPELGLDFYNGLDMTLEEFKEKMLKVDNNYDLSDKFNDLPKNAASLLQTLLNINPNLRYSSITA